jgi:GntR family transcriptional regulator/MocR family aminotransferase
MHAEFDFRPGIADVSRFPFASWRARMTRQYYPDAVGTGTYIDAAGHAGLRAAIARHIGVSRAVRATPEDVIITNGSQQAVDLIARVLLERGDVVALEDPCYPLARRVFQAHECRLVGVPVDSDGLVVDAMPKHARLVYVTPSHQYPLGVAMSMERRQALIDWARRADATIVEDDYDSEFRYDGRPLHSLHSVDGSGRVLYVGSLSKTMFPTLRLGFVVAPAPLGAALRKAKLVADWHTAVATQAAAAGFIDDGLLAQHIRRMRRVYAERHERLREVLAAELGGRLTPLPSASGLHLAAYVRGVSAPVDHAIARRASTVGVSVFPFSRHFVTARPKAGLLLGYGAIPLERIAEGLRRLRGCF